MDSAEIASAVTVIGIIFNYFGFTSIDSGMITGFVNGLIAVVMFAAAIWSAYQHRVKNNIIAKQ